MKKCRNPTVETNNALLLITLRTVFFFENLFEYSFGSHFTGIMQRPIILLYLNFLEIALPRFELGLPGSEPDVLDH